MMLSFSREDFFLSEQAARIGANHFNPRIEIEFSFCKTCFLYFGLPLFLVFVLQVSHLKSWVFTGPGFLLLPS